MVHEFLAAEFSRVVEPGSEHEYKLSIAIAEKLLGPLNTENGGSTIPAGSQFGGLIYPALAMSANADNLALLPEIVDQHLDLEQVEYIRVEDKTSETQFQVTVLDFANSWGSDGSIEWKGRRPQWQIQAGEAVQVSVENGRWVARDVNGEIIEPS